MPTERQIAANRLNALKSTGPRTPAGKAAASMNALKSGIDAKAQVIPGEDPAELAALAHAYHQRFRATNPEENFLIDTLIDSEWLLRRYRRVEAQIWQFQMNSAYELDDDCPLGHAFSRGDHVFARLQRRIDSARRTYDRALEKLEALVRARAIQPADPEPLTAPEPSQIGFVPHPQPPAAAGPGPRPLPPAPAAPASFRGPSEPGGFQLP